MPSASEFLGLGPAKGPSASAFLNAPDKPQPPGFFDTVGHAALASGEDVAGQFEQAIGALTRAQVPGLDTVLNKIIPEAARPNPELYERTGQALIKRASQDAQRAQSGSSAGALVGNLLASLPEYTVGLIPTVIAQGASAEREAAARGDTPLQQFESGVTNAALNYALGRAGAGPEGSLAKRLVTSTAIGAGYPVASHLSQYAIDKGASALPTPGEEVPMAALGALLPLVHAGGAHLLGRARKAVSRHTVEVQPEPLDLVPEVPEAPSASAYLGLLPPPAPPALRVTPEGQAIVPGTEDLMPEAAARQHPGFPRNASVAPEIPPAKTLTSEPIVEPEPNVKAEAEPRAAGRLFSKGSPEERAWREAADEYLKLADDKALFQHPISNAEDMAEIARETDPAIKISDPHEPHPQERAQGVRAVWEVHMPDGRQGWIRLLGDNRLMLDASKLAAGHSAGHKLYHIVANFAHNMGLKFEGDAAGLSEDALYRRTENMLSSALKFGTTRHLAPHPRQLEPDIEGVHPLEWEDGNDRENIAHLLETSYKNVANKVPEIADLWYNFTHGKFEQIEHDGRGNSRARPISERDWEALANTRGAKAARARSNTLKRAVLAKSLLQRVSQVKGEQHEVLAGDAGERGPLGRVAGTELEGTSYSHNPAAHEPAPRPLTIPETRRILSQTPLGRQFAALERAGVLRFEFRPGEDWNGYWDGKQAVLNTARLGEPNTFPVAMHELGGHAGLRDMVGPKVFDSIVSDLKALARTNTAAGRIVQRAMNRIEAAHTPTGQFDQELAAYTIEEALKEGKAWKQSGKLNSALVRLFNRLRAWAKASRLGQAAVKAGVPLKFTPDDLLGLADSAVRRLGREAERVETERREPAPITGETEPLYQTGDKILNGRPSPDEIASKYFSRSPESIRNEQLFKQARAAKDLDRDTFVRPAGIALPDLDKEREPVPTHDIELALHVLHNDRSLDALDALTYLKSAIDAGMTAKDNRVFGDYIEQQNLPEAERTITLTPRQQELFDTYIAPLRDSMEHSEGYVPREAIGKGGKLDRLLKAGGQFGVATLRKTLPSQKHRVFKAVTDATGKRTIVAVKRNGKKLLLTGFRNGQPFHFGTITRTTSDAELEKKLVPLDEKIRKLRQEKNLLTATKSRANASRRRVANIDNEISDLLAEKDAISGEDEAINGTFYTRAGGKEKGKRFTVGEATTNEIEQHTHVRYHRNLMGKLLDEYVAMRQTQRQTRFLDDLKESPEFAEIATQDFAKAPPKWRPVNLQQFHGYLFEPYTAEVLNHYAAKMRGERRVPYLSTTNDLLRKAMFSILPLWHDFNLIDIGLNQRGLIGNIGPAGIRRLTKTLVPAIHEVMTLGPKYQRIMEKGGPMMRANSMLGMIRPEAYASIVNSLGRELDEKPELHPIAKALGFVPGQVWKGMQWWGNHAQQSIWTFNDVVAMQAIMERELQGMSEDEAVKAVFKILPSYRLPEGSRLLNIVTHPDISWFARYHLGLFRAYGDMMKRLLSKHSTIKDRARAADQLAMVGLMALVVYPTLDAVIQQTSGNKKGHLARFGLSAIPYDLYKVSQGQENLIHFLVKQFTPAPGTYEILQQAFNRDFWSGDEVAPFYDSTWDQAVDRVKHLSDTNIPLSNFLEGATPTQGLLRQIGVEIPATREEKAMKRRREEREKRIKEHEYFAEHGG